MKIVIVGGGTAGWINLAYIAAKTDLDITIIHSDEIDIVGVGESTGPTLRLIADAVGVDEKIWMKDSKATFKYGLEFFDWNTSGSQWFHSFEGEIPHQAFHNPIIDFGRETYEQELTSIDYFLKMRQSDSSFDTFKFNNMHGPMWTLLESGKGHYNKDGLCNISKFAGYAYHVNAFDYSQTLRKHTAKKRYKEIIDTIVDVELDDNGIKTLITKSGLKITGDIFVDCSGMKRLLISKLSSFQNYKDLKNDRAIFGSIDNLQESRASTQVHAQDNGWIWTTPTWGRVGSGYVYSSHFLDDDAAHETLFNFWNKKGYRWKENNRIKFTSGCMKDIAIKNVISNGLAQSFIEPLEATSIMVTCYTAITFVEIYKRHQTWNKGSSKLLHKIMTKFLDNTLSFVRYHYELSERNDSEYWKSYNNTQAVEEVNDIISSKLNSPMLMKGQTLLNKYNWSSMLVGYNKPFFNELRSIQPEQMENYLHFCKEAENNYKFIIRNNPLNKDVLENIHLKKDK